MPAPPAVAGISGGRAAAARKRAIGGRIRANRPPAFAAATFRSVRVAGVRRLGGRDRTCPGHGSDTARRRRRGYGSRFSSASVSGAIRR
jgi:hypothetical protein